MLFGSFSFWKGFFLLSSALNLAYPSGLLKNERFIVLNGYHLKGNLLRSISEVESPEEYSVWCQTTEAYCLDVEGTGSDKSIGILLPQIPVDNITFLQVKANYEINLRNANVCLLSKLQRLLFDYFTPIDMGDTKSTFHGLDHLWAVDMHMISISVSPVGMMHLVDSTKERLLIEIQAVIEVLDVWPLCLAQKQKNLDVDLNNNRIFNFQNTPSTALCNIKEAVEADAEIRIRQNAIAHVSDITGGWGFDFLRHVIVTLIRENSTIFPIELEGNRLSVTVGIWIFTKC